MKSFKHLWTDKWLLDQRMVCDPIVDKIVDRVIEEHKVGAVRKMFQTLVTNKDVKYKELPHFIKDYFEQSQALPDYADAALIAKGQEVFRRHGPTMTMLLMFKSLPQSYACANGVQVLFSTGRLTTQSGLEPFKRRLMETAQFVLNVMTKDGLEPGSEGIITALKVRLIHSSIRHFLSEGEWDTEKLGKPLNQEDLAGTLMAFSALVLEGLESLNVVLTEEEKEAFIHCWNVVGHFMGVQRELIPADAQEADDLGNLIFQQQMAYSDEGKVLTEALLEFLHEMMPGKHGKTPEIMLHYLLGQEASESVGLEVKRTLWELIVEWFLKHIFKHKDRHLHIGNIVNLGDNLKMKLLQGSINHINHHKNVEFVIPPGLKKDWGL